MTVQTLWLGGMQMLIVHRGKNVKKNAKSLLAAAMLTTLTHGQTPTIRQRSTRSTCSNIIALAGNVKVDCSKLTPEQDRLLRQIPAMLNKVLANQLDPDSVMKKLDEIAAIKAAQTQSNSGGINIQQGTTGANSPIVNSPITVGNIPKRIAPEDMPKIVQFLAKAPNKATIIILADQFSGASQFPDDLYDAFKAAGWQMKENGVNRFMAFPQPGRRFQGAEVSMKGEPVGPAGVTATPADALYYVGEIIKISGLQTSLNRNESIEDGVITITLLGGFPDQN
ncbi:MAG: hypothetical protein JSS95_12815 [Acidobacteria bacterium]|nr:hypothetical protein [Acidobacteriota bacterium]